MERPPHGPDSALALQPTVPGSRGPPGPVTSRLGLVPLPLLSARHPQSHRQVSPRCCSLWLPKLPPPPRPLPLPHQVTWAPKPQSFSSIVCKMGCLSSGCYNKHHRLGSLNNRHLFLTVMETGMSKVKVPTGSVLLSALFLACR